MIQPVAEKRKYTWNLKISKSRILMIRTITIILLNLRSNHLNMLLKPSLKAISSSKHNKKIIRNKLKHSSLHSHKPYPLIMLGKWQYNSSRRIINILSNTCLIYQINHLNMRMLVYLISKTLLSAAMMMVSKWTPLKKGLPSQNVKFNSMPILTMKIRRLKFLDQKLYNLNSNSNNNSQFRSKLSNKYNPLIKVNRWLQASIDRLIFLIMSINNSNNNKAIVWHLLYQFLKIILDLVLLSSSSNLLASRIKINITIRNYLSNSSKRYHNSKRVYNKPTVRNHSNQPKSLLKCNQLIYRGFKSKWI